MSTYDEIKARSSVEPVLFLHVSGLPYVWWSHVPEWTPRTGFTYLGGLRATDDTVVESEIDIIGSQIETPSKLTVRIDADSAGVLEDLFALKKGTEPTKSKPLKTASLTAGESPASIQVSGVIDDAASTGNIYIGTETISYTSRTTTGDQVFSGTSRGRYHHLDSDLDEVTHITELTWDELFQRPPLVSIRPTTMRGRYMTLYRTFVDPVSGQVLPNTEHEVLWRGRVTMHSYVGLAWEISGTSLTEELDTELMPTPVSVPLSGYATPSSRNQNIVSLGLNISWVGLNDLDLSPDVFLDIVEGPYPSTPRNLASGSVTPAFSYGEDIEIDLDVYNTPQKIVSRINELLSAAYDRATAPLPCPVTFSVYQGVCTIEQQAFGVGVSTHTATTVTWGRDLNPVTVPDLYLRPVYTFAGREILQILGLSDGGDITLKSLSDADYETSSDGYSADTPSQKEHERWYGEEKVKKAWIKWGHQPREKFTVNAADGTYQEWVQFGDASGTFVLVDKVGVLRLRGWNSSALEVSFIGASDDPVLRRDYAEPISVDWDASGDDNVKVTQVWRPLYRSKDPTTWARVEGVQVLFLRMLLSTGDGARYNTNYDILVADLGLGLPEDFVDVESFERMQDSLGALELDRDYVFHEPIDLLDLLSEEMRLLGHAIVVKQGRLTCVPLRAPAYDANAPHISASTRLPGEKIALHTDDHDRVTQIQIEYDYDLLAEKYLGKHIELSKSDHGITRQTQAIKLQIPGIRRSTWPVDPAAMDGLRGQLLDLADRANQERLLYRARCSRELEGVMPGDAVMVTDDRVHDQYTGSIGIASRPALVTRVSWDVHAGVVEIDCILWEPALLSDWTPWVTANRAAAPGSPWALGTLVDNGFTASIDDDRIMADTTVSVTDVETGESSFATVTDRSGSNITLDRGASGPGIKLIAHAGFDDVAKRQSSVDAVEVSTFKLSPSADVIVRVNPDGTITARVGRLS